LIFTPGSSVKIKRYDGYAPNTAYEDRTGFGGYKQACFDTVTFRIVTEPQARVAGLKTGELQGVREEERARVAREIHDELGQALTSIDLDPLSVARELPRISLSAQLSDSRRSRSRRIGSRRPHRCRRHAHGPRAR